MKTIADAAERIAKYADETCLEAKWNWRTCEFDYCVNKESLKKNITAELAAIVEERDARIRQLEEQLAAYKILEADAGYSPSPSTFIRQKIRISFEVLEPDVSGWMMQRVYQGETEPEIDLAVDGVTLWPTAQQAVLAAIRSGWIKQFEEPAALVGVEQEEQREDSVR